MYCLFCVVLFIVSVYMCSVLLPAGGYPIAVNKYIISYHIISYHIISYHLIAYHIISYHIISYHIISYHIIAYHIISYHIISYHIIAYHIIYSEEGGSSFPRKVHHYLPQQSVLHQRPMATISLFTSVRSPNDLRVKIRYYCLLAHHLLKWYILHCHGFGSQLAPQADPRAKLKYQRWTMP